MQKRKTIQINKQIDYQMHATEAGLVLLGSGKGHFLIFNTRGRFWLFVSI